MTATPRATPVVQAPARAIHAQDPLSGKPLHAPVMVVAMSGEWELAIGELTIGRDPDASVVLEDSLVSRFHARLSVDANEDITLEDLHSTNGTFVNGNKMTRPSTQLHEGDRLLIGTTEVSIFGLRASAQLQLKQRLAPAPISTLARIAKPLPPTAVAMGVVAERGRPFAVTGRSDAITLVGQCADQLMSSGHTQEAVRLLSGHLDNLLRGASAGLNVPKQMLTSATKFALKLFDWTERDAWITYVLELHIACQQVPSEADMDALVLALGSLGNFDYGHIGYFIKALERRAVPPTAEERARLKRLEPFAGIPGGRP